MNKYSVERRGGKYYLYRPNGAKVFGQEAFLWERRKVAEMFTLAAQLNKKSGYV